MSYLHDLPDNEARARRREVLRFLLTCLFALAVTLLLASCTSFQVILPDGTSVRENGAPVVSGEASLEVCVETRDDPDNPEGIIVTSTVARNKKENADGQVAMAELLLNAGKAAAGAR